MDQRAHWQSALTEQIHNRASDTAHAASGAGNEDGVLNF
jgi:hypothetical protein